MLLVRATNSVGGQDNEPLVANAGNRWLNVLAVHDKIRDKMYLDIRQTFSVWFLPMYHAHVRLVTVLDLVASDDADFHDPLDRIIKQDEDSEKSTAQILFDSMSEQGHHRRHSRAGNNGPRRYKIQRQEDLYQVNDFLKFVGGPGPLPFLWFLFQLQATVICVLMSLFVRISPWAFQPDPAKGGVEAIIERVESYHTITSSERGGTKEESPRHVDDLDKKPSHQHIEDKKPPVTLVIKNTHGENKNGGEKAAEGSGATNAHNGNHHTQENEQQHQQKPKHNEQQDNASNSGRESANSKVSPTQPRKKSGKKGGR